MALLRPLLTAQTCPCYKLSPFKLVLGRVLAMNFTKKCGIFELEATTMPLSSTLLIIVLRFHTNLVPRPLASLQVANNGIDVDFRAPSHRLVGQLCLLLPGPRHKDVTRCGHTLFYTGTLGTRCHFDSDGHHRLSIVIVGNSNSPHAILKKNPNVFFQHIHPRAIRVSEHHRRIRAS